MPESGEVRLPLTPAQSGIWYAQRIDSSHTVYNIAEYLDIHGPVDPYLFESALRRVVGETDALRVRFVENGEHPEQLVLPAVDFTVPVHDLTGEPDPLGSARALMDEDNTLPIDLFGDRLFAFALFRVAEDRWLWYHRVHHILLDGAGVAMLAPRVSEVYSALTAGSPCPTARSARCGNWWRPSRTTPDPRRTPPTAPTGPSGSPARRTPSASPAAGSTCPAR